MPAGHLPSLAEGGSLFAGSAAAKLGRLASELGLLAARYDVVVAVHGPNGSGKTTVTSLARLRGTYVLCC